MMKSPLAVLGVIRVDYLNEALCARCHSLLDRHQPDDDRPDRLLGTCTECGLWHLIDQRSGEMFVLPEPWTTRRAK